MSTAKQALRMMEHQQILMKARLNKLQKEEEAANNRIKQSLRQQDLMQQMQQIKADRLNQKAELFMKYKMEEDTNRARIHQMRSVHVQNLESNKKHIFDSNCHDQKQIKVQQAKIKETIMRNKQAAAQERQRAFQNSYDIKRKAAMVRKANQI